MDPTGDGQERRSRRWVVPVLVTIGVVVAVALAWSLIAEPAESNGAASDLADVEAVATGVPAGALGQTQAAQGSGQANGSAATTERSGRAGSRPAGAANGPAGQAPGSAASTAETMEAPEPAKPADEPAAAATGIVAIAGLDGVNLAESPGGATVQSLPLGATLTVMARSQDGNWLRAQADDGATGWTEASSVIGFDLERLPVADVTATQTTPESATAVDPAQKAEEPPATPAASDKAVVTLPSSTPADGSQAMPPLAVEEETQIVATVSLSGARLNVRAGPGTEYETIAKANPGDRFAVLGRSEAGDWLQISLGGKERAFGWVAAEFVSVNGSPESLPIRTDLSDAPIWSDSTATAEHAAATPANLAVPAATTRGDTGLAGKLVFQSTHGGIIYAYDLATGQLWPLTTGFDPAISPEGQRVAFTRDGGENGVYLIDVDGGNERLIFSGRATLASPKWSPDGAWIAFSRGDEYDECYEFAPNRCLTEDELPDRLPPGALQGIPVVKQYKQKLAVVDADGGNYHDVASLDSARAPDWSDQGIVYQSKAGIQWTADEANVQNRLVSFDYLKPFYHDPDWQPDSQRIAFMSMEASHWEIFVVNADGTEMTALTRPVTALVEVIPSNVAPAWSPDGQSIVYVSNRGEDNSAGEWRLWVMDADGGNQRPLPVDVAIDYTFGDEQAVSWGP